MTHDDCYVALLRGINVGGGNLIPMTALRASFEGLGFRDVVTYIQSGNVVFRTKPMDPLRMTARIERALSEAFGFPALVVLRSHAQMGKVVKGAPAGFGEEPGEYRYDVVYLKEPLSVAEALRSVRTREDVDEARPGDGVIYFSRVISRASQSYLPKLASLPVYKRMTVRNWNTTTKLLTLMDGAPDVARKGGRPH